MCKCRYYGKCAGNCDGHGLVLGFGNETYDCDDFKPMPDVDALLALVDEMDKVAQRRRSMGYEGFAIGDEDRARRIREALGVSGDE